nr:hypothetical protein CFP56_26437 [Quercus suber]
MEFKSEPEEELFLFLFCCFYATSSIPESFAYTIFSAPKQRAHSVDLSSLFVEIASIDSSAVLNSCNGHGMV